MLNSTTKEAVASPPLQGEGQGEDGVMRGQTSKNIGPKKLPQRLRKHSTDTERALWRLLRDRRFSGLKFRRDHPFGEYVLDFVCLKTGLIIEVDGGQHGEQQEYDERRTRNLEAAGFRLIRFWDNEVLRQAEAVKERIWLTLQEIQEQK